MKSWIASQLGETLSCTSGIAVVLDPDGVLDESALTDVEAVCRVIRVHDWASIRRAWDLDIRRRVPGEALTLVCVSSAEFTTVTDLPWDIEQEADEVIRLRWPVPTEIRALLRVADPASAENLLRDADKHADAADIMASAYGIVFGDPGSEIEGVVRHRLVPETTDELWDALAGVLTTPAARSIAIGRGDLAELQQMWDNWLRNGHGDGSDAFLDAPGAILGLLGAGLLKPAPLRASSLPDWAQVGALSPDPEQLIDELLAVQPSLPSDLAGWIETASWWGQVRATIAATPNPPDNAETAWQVWEDLDDRFRPWLRNAYGSCLLSAAPFAALRQVAHRLARRVEEGARILLVVVDGLGFAQWHPLRRATGLTVHDATGSLAMIPTLTSVPRQAILSGKLPREFVEHIGNTSAEEQQWKKFWRGQGIADGDISYAKTLGHDVGAIPEMHGRVAAVVVNAVDDILHGADVLGDRQVAVGIDLWARAGFLKNLIDVATRSGYEIWITSDHGNLPTLASGTPREGQTVEQAGTRVRIYPNATLREQYAEHGEIWDPPGLPTEGAGYFPLFAPGRSGYHTGASRVSHGGISLDEVIVPVARVST